MLDTGDNKQYVAWSTWLFVEIICVFMLPNINTIYVVRQLFFCRSFVFKMHFSMDISWLVLSSWYRLSVGCAMKRWMVCTIHWSSFFWFSWLICRLSCSLSCLLCVRLICDAHGWHVGLAVVDLAARLSEKLALKCSGAL
jgi:hypothetical protein